MNNNLNNLLGELENKISFGKITNQHISQGSVAWHIEHSLLVLDGVIESLKKSNPKEYKWTFNFMRMVALTIKKFPRGKAKAPKSVRPTENISENNLKAHLAQTRNKIDELKVIPKDSYFEHPFFGKLALGQTINFLEIHTKHHLNIINDSIDAH